MSNFYMSGRRLSGVKPLRVHGVICGCNRPKKSWQRFCPDCWFKIPADLREKLLDSNLRFNIPEYRALMREARRLIDAAEEAA